MEVDSVLPADPGASSHAARYYPTGDLARARIGWLSRTDKGGSTFVQALSGEVSASTPSQVLYDRLLQAVRPLEAQLLVKLLRCRQVQLGDGNVNLDDRPFIAT